MCSAIVTNRSNKTTYVGIDLAERICSLSDVAYKFVLRWNMKLNRSARADIELNNPVWTAPRMIQLIIVSVRLKRVREQLRTNDRMPGVALDINKLL